MDSHNLPRVVSRLCSDHEHDTCVDSDCRCECHRVCAACLSTCQATYDATDEIGKPFFVCADCYVTIEKSRKLPRCEDCGVVTAYCDPAVGDFYLCLHCHQQRTLS